jgi:putative component of toxin-antitoxin plasmid stabilization module
MFEVKRTDAFDSWLNGLKDSKGRAKIQARIYYARAGRTLYLLLCGGDKGSQNADIKNAHATWRELNPPAKKPTKKE